MHMVERCSFIGKIVPFITEALEFDLLKSGNDDPRRLTDTGWINKKQLL